MCGLHLARRTAQCLKIPLLPPSFNCDVGRASSRQNMHSLPVFCLESDTSARDIRSFGWCALVYCHYLAQALVLAANKPL